MTFRTRVLAFTFLAYGAIAGYGVVAEFLSLSATTSVLAINGRGVPTLSITSEQQDLDRCATALLGIRASLQTSLVQKAAAKQCQAHARAIITGSPTNGRAHFLLAVAAHRLDDTETFRHHFRMSQLYSRNEGWLSHRRFAVLINDAPPDTAGLLAGEIATMLTMQSGAERLARSFARDPMLRPSIRAVLRVSDQHLQQRFLNLLRRQGFAA